MEPEFCFDEDFEDTCSETDLDDMSDWISECMWQGLDLHDVDLDNEPVEMVEGVTLDGKLIPREDWG